MSVIRKGLYIELSNRSTNRVVFSAATDELEKRTFDELWKVIGDNIYNGQGKKHEEQISYYELRIAPLYS